MATTIVLNGQPDEEQVKLLKVAGCKVEQNKSGVSIEIPGECLHICELASQISTQAWCYLYVYVYKLEGSARLIYREKVSGPIGKTRTSIELLVLLNTKGG